MVLPEQFSRVGRACRICFRKSLVLRWLGASLIRGLGENLCEITFVPIGSSELRVLVRDTC